MYIVYVYVCDRKVSVPRVSTGVQPFASIWVQYSALISFEPENLGGQSQQRIHGADQDDKLKNPLKEISRVFEFGYHYVESKLYRNMTQSWHLSVSTFQILPCNLRPTLRETWR